MKIQYYKRVSEAYRFLAPISHQLATFSLVMSMGLMFLVPSAHGDTAFWNWAGGDRDWSTAGNWTPAIPTDGNDVIFGNTDAQTATTPVNTVPLGLTVRSLSYTNSSASAYTSYQNTTLASGQILIVTDGLNVGVGSTPGYAADPYTYATITGAGGVVITGGNVRVGEQSVNNSTATAFLRGLLDARGLDVFVYLNPAGTFSVAGGSTRRQGGEVFLGGTNSISAAALLIGVGTGGVGSAPGYLHLGTSNNLFADTITVGRLTGALIDFQTGLNNPIVNVRSKDGVTGTPNWFVGWNSAGNAAVNSFGTNDFSSGILNAAATNLFVGLFSATGDASARSASGYLTIGTNASNSLVAQNLFVGANTNAASTATASAVGNLNVRGGTVTAGTVTLALRAGSGSATGNLRLNDATMKVNGNITAGGGTNTISVSNATLTVGGRIGTPTSGIRNINLDSATLGLTLVAPGGYTQASASVGNLNIEGASGSTLLKINNAIPAPGQYPLFVYTNLGGAAGFSGFSLLAPGSATLSNNVSSLPNTVDVVIPGLVWDGTPNGDWDIAGNANWKFNGASALYRETAVGGDHALFNDDATGTRTVNLTTNLSPLTLVVSNAGGDYVFTGSGKISGPTGIIKNGSGMLTITTSNDFSGTSTISDGPLQISHGSALGNPATNATIANAGNARLELDGGITVTKKLTLNGKTGTSTTARHIQNVSGTNTVAGEITGNTGGSLWGFRSGSAAGRLIISGPFSNVSGATGTRTLHLFGAGDGDWATDFPAGPAGATYQVRKDGTGTWTISAFNSYTHETYAYGGTLLVNGTISSAANVIVGDPAASTPATLGGTGTINGPVTVNTNGTLAPGASIGTLTINNSLTTLGTNVFELNTDTLEHDLVTGLSSVTYGGTLVISTSGSGTAITNGASFQLFSASSYSGAFDTIVPAVPGPGLAWDMSQLTVSGTLGIIPGTDTTPTNLNFTATGNVLNLSWPASHTGWRLEAQTNNLSVGINTNWFTVPGSANTNQVFMPVNPANDAVFYRLVFP